MREFYLLGVPREVGELLKSQFSVQIFQRDFSIFYANQIPNVALYLVSGEMELVGKKQKEIVQPGHIVGLAHHYHQILASSEAIIKAGSSGIVLDREALSPQQQKSAVLNNFFQSYLNSAAPNDAKEG